MGDFAPQKRFEAKQKARGLIRVAVWVPAEQKDALSKYAKTLRTAKAPD